MRSPAVLSRVALSIGLLLPMASSVVAQKPDAIWLDRPLTSWNKAGDSLPKPPSLEESKSAVISRCHLIPSVSTAAERAMDTAGWIPFLNFDQQLVQEDVEIVGGMRGADGMCRPEAYNLFVFVGGRFAGLLSPALMTSRLDGSSGAVRLRPPDISAEFARYGSNDPLCCPSSHVTVRYRIDRTGDRAVVVPVEVRTTRR
jgi:LppP/LprE lipoprotein